jgi:predicted dehydrogenase
MRPRRADGALHVALVGFGLGGAVFHAPFIAATPGLRLAAVVTRDPERQAQAAREHPGVALLDHVDRVWERADDYDLAVIAAPNAAHAPLAMRALAAGLHVVVDKPFAATAADARVLAEEARARGLFAAPYHNRRWDGDFLTVRRLVADGTLGAVQRFESRFDRWRAVAKPRWTSPDADTVGEGIDLDLHTHLVDQALVLCGPVAEVYAEYDRRHPDVTAADDVFLALTHASGARSHLTASTAAGLQGPRFAVFGTRAAYVKQGADPQEDALRAGVRPGGPGWGEEPPERWGRVGAGGVGEPVRTEAGAYQRYYAGVVAALRDDAPRPVAPEDAVAGLEVIEAARRSAAERRVVTL